MSLFAIGDLHLSLGGEKPMDVFGGRWQDYTEKIVKGFGAVVGEEDNTQGQPRLLVVYGVQGQKILCGKPN